MELSPGSVGLDIGCGNGKYMNLNKNILIIGSDRSSELAAIAFSKGESMVADALNLPFRANRCDFAISIAVIHHFSTPKRRVEAVRSILNVLNCTGKALIYVWALEQASSRRGYHEGMDPDVMVPWVLQQKNKKHLSSGSSLVEDSKDNIKHRYYHLYKQGELESDVNEAGGVVVTSGYEKDNWWAVISRN